MLSGRTTTQVLSAPMLFVLMNLEVVWCGVGSGWDEMEEGWHGVVRCAATCLLCYLTAASIARPDDPPHMKPSSRSKRPVDSNTRSR